jgi:hypothetical protein
MPRLKIALKAKNIQNTFFDIEQMMLKLIKALMTVTSGNMILGKLSFLSMLAFSMNMLCARPVISANKPQVMTPEQR